RAILRSSAHLPRALAHPRQRIDSLHLRERPAHRVRQRLPRLLLVGDEVREDFRVGLGGELVPGAGQRLLQLEVILDDAVVHHRDAAVLVRVRVLVGWLAVRGPAGMTDAGHPARRLLPEPLLEIRELPLGPDDGEPFLAQYRHARRVIASVLELAQPVHQQGRALLVAHVSHDAAHALPPPLHPNASIQPRSGAPTAYFLPFFSTHPSMLRCFPALTAKDPGGTSSRTVVPVPT